MPAEARPVVRGAALSGRCPGSPAILLVLACWLTQPGSAAAQDASPGTAATTDADAGTDYVAARGLRLGGTGLTIGAFATVELDNEQGEEGVVALDSVNPLVLWEPIDFARAFLELEVGGLFTWQPGTGAVESSPDLVIERVYLDVSGGDAFNIRLGKFQTPVGIWNLVPAEPFTWTATSPALVEAAFDEHQTGGALFGTFYPGGSNVEYWAYGQFLDPLDPSEDAADRGVGARLRVSGVRGDWALGGSYLSSKRERRWSHLGGIDVFWSRGPLELQGELAFVRGDIPGRDLVGAYGQAAWHLGAHLRSLAGLHLVGRYELFDRSAVPASHIGNIGLAFLPKPFLNVKAGYQHVSEPTEHAASGAFASISVIF
jgi:hypothetical protein